MTGKDSETKLWHHLTESTEESNHHTQNNFNPKQLWEEADFIIKTQFIGALFWLFPSAENYSSRLRGARIQTKGKPTSGLLIFCNQEQRPVTSYTSIISKEPESPKLSVGQTQKLTL